MADELRGHMGLAAAGRDTIKVSHILIKHSGSRKAASRLDPSGARIRQRSLAAARASLITVRRRLVAAIASMQADPPNEHSALPRAAAPASGPVPPPPAPGSADTALTGDRSDAAAQRAQQGGAGGTRGASAAAQANQCGGEARQGRVAGEVAAAARLREVEQLFASAARDVSDCNRLVTCHPPPAPFLSTPGTSRHTNPCQHCHSCHMPAMPARPAARLPAPASCSFPTNTARARGRALARSSRPLLQLLPLLLRF